MERMKLFVSRSAVTKVQAVIVAVIIVVAVIAGAAYYFATYYFPTLPAPTPTPTPATPTPATPTPATPTPATPTPATPTPATPTPATPTPATPTPKPLTGQILKIGLASPLSGPMAPFGLQGKRGMEMAIDEINSAGGILGAFVQMIVEDFAGDPKTAVSATEKLITVDKCQVVRVAFHSSSILSAMEVTERYEIPLVTIGGVADELTMKGYKYIFRVCANTTQASSGTIEFAAIYFKPRTVAIMHENSLMGMSYVDKDVKIIQRLHPEWQILTTEAYDAKALDFKPLLEKINLLDPDLLILHPYLTDAALILKQMKEIGFKPDLVIAGGTPDLSFIELLGDEGHYRLFGVEFWCDKRYNATAMRELALKFWNRYGKPLDFQANEGYLGVQIIKRAVEQCKSLNSKAIRDSLATVDFEIPYFGRVKFLPNGQLLYPVHVVQIQPANPDEPWNVGGWTYHTVYPPEFATAKVIIP
jgi:branched-chain amino acid transport system substrate-binding protein